MLQNYMMPHLLDGNNIRAWKFQINNILRSQELQTVVDESYEKPANDAAEKDKSAWLQRDGKAMAILFASLNHEQASHLLDCKTLWTF